MSDLEAATARRDVLVALVADYRAKLSLAWAENFRGGKVKALVESIASAQREVRQIEKAHPSLAPLPLPTKEG